MQQGSHRDVADNGMKALQARPFALHAPIAGLFLGIFRSQHSFLTAFEGACC